MECEEEKIDRGRKMRLGIPYSADWDVVKLNFTTSQFYCGNSDIGTLLFENTDK